jgi:hypothetical protein
MKWDWVSVFPAGAASTTRTATDWATAPFEIVKP